MNGVVATFGGVLLALVLFVPYAAWVAFATLLNVSIAVLN